MRWYKQTMYIRRNDEGVIVGISETKPKDYESIYEERRRKAHRASVEVEGVITDYAKRKIAEKRKWMGD